jgi:hypothetical protein
MHASDVEPLNVIERYAFALACIERLCHSWGVVDEPFVRAVIDAHWTLTTKKVLSNSRVGYNWFDETREFDPRTPEEFAARVRPGSLSADQVQALHHAIGELRALAGGDMYCQAESFRSLAPALNVAGILLRWGVGLPRVELFRRGVPTGGVRLRHQPSQPG